MESLKFGNRLISFKHTLLILLCFNVLLAIGQDGPYSVSIQHQPLEEALIQLERTSDLRFSYSTDQVRKFSVDLELEEVTLDSLLTALFRGTHLTWSIKNKNYIVVSSLWDQRDTIELCGTIIDKETGEALALANIYHFKSFKGTTSDVHGKFQMKLEVAPLDTFLVSYIGYNTVKIGVSEFLRNKCPDIHLNFKSNEELYIVVTDYMTSGVSLGENGLSTDVDLNKMSSMPGNIDGGALAVAKFLPGITSTTSKASDIYIRGTTPDQSLILWEGIPIYHAAHNFDMISAINPDIVDRAQVYRGGFSAEYGGRLGGRIELSTDSISNNGKIGIGTNLTNVFSYVKKRLDSRRKLDLSLSVRRSFNDILSTPTYDRIAEVNQQGLLFGDKDLSDLPPEIDVSQEASFYDAMLKLSGMASIKDAVSVSGLISQDEYFTKNYNDREKNQNFHLDSLMTKSYGSSVKWTRQWSNHFESNLDLIHTQYDLDYRFRVTPPKDSARSKTNLYGAKTNSVIDNQLRLATKYRSSKGYDLGIGYHLVHTQIHYDVSSFAEQAQGEIRESDQTTGGHHSLYTIFQSPMKKSFGVNAGLRTSYYSVNRSFYFEPRIQLSYRIVENLTAHLYYGRHHQYIAQVAKFPGSEHGLEFNIWTMSEDKTFQVQESEIFQLGSVFQKNGWTLDLQAYFKKIDGLNSRFFDIPNISNAEIIPAFVTARGIDILVNKRISRLNVWLSYSLSNTTATFNDPRLLESHVDYDQRHALSFVSQVNIGLVDLSVGLNFFSGIPFTPLESFKKIQDMSGSMRPTQFELIFSEDVNSERLDSRFEVNATVQYQWTPEKRSWRAVFAAGITNLLNNRNTYSRNYFIRPLPMGMGHTDTFIDKINLGFTPNLSIRFEWH